MKTNIALIGFMGTGKTTVGKSLAKKLGKKFIEVDELITKRAGRSIPRIFTEDGETKFRELEMELTKEVGEMENAVISCGGGLVLNKINIDRLKKNSIVILLEAPHEIILKRISNDNGRPLLNTPDQLKEIKNLLEAREPFYKSAADVVIDTTDLNVVEVVNEIIDQVSS